MFLICSCLSYFYDTVHYFCAPLPSNNSKQYENPEARVFLGSMWRDVSVFSKAPSVGGGGFDGGSPPFKIAYGECVCPFPNCPPHLLEWGARQPAGTALVDVRNIVCSLHIWAVSCVGVLQMQDGAAASDRRCADFGKNPFAVEAANCRTFLYRCFRFKDL